MVEGLAIYGDQGLGGEVRVVLVRGQRGVQFGGPLTEQRRPFQVRADQGMGLFQVLGVLEAEKAAGRGRIELRVAAVGEGLLEPVGQRVDHVVPADVLVLDELLEYRDRRRNGTGLRSARYSMLPPLRGA